MTLSLTIQKLEKEDWFKSVKVFVYVAVSFGLAFIPAHFAHNNTYLTLVAPINVALVNLRKIFQTAKTAEATLPVADQSAINNDVAAVESIVASPSVTQIPVASAPTDPTTPTA